MLIDTHAHLQDEELVNDVEAILQRARQAGVESIICVGYDYPSSLKAMEIARKYAGVYAVVGVHPHDAETLNEEIMAQLYKMAQDPKVVAIGEIGLDYYRDLSPRDRQKEAFIAQIKLAQELYKPVVIHDRDAHQDVLEIIKKEKAGKNEGIMHCYSGNLPLAIEAMKQGFYLSFAGPLTFKNNKKTVEVAAKVTLERILVETDCPYLAPEPLRGKRNEPANVVHTARKLAEIRKKTFEEIAYLTSHNARRVYRITN
ncbi:MAG: TatD family hydrolase [Syntrophomonadaceae bacterium]|jgi:TatD DNase family protein